MIEPNNNWGPDLWRGIHSVIRFYPEEPSETERESYKLFLMSLAKVLPCDRCKEHFSEFLKNVNFSELLMNQFTLVKGIIELHNDINKRNGKPIMEYQDALKVVYSGDSESNNNTLYITLLVVVISIILFRVSLS